MDNWDKYSRNTIDWAYSATHLGFGLAKNGTRLGFSLARTTLGVVDLVAFGGTPLAVPVLEGVLNIAEQVALAPIHLGEYITNTSLYAAHSSVNVLSVIFPGSSDASFSLASFIPLVRREWSQNPGGDVFPEKQYGVIQVARAVIAWVALQGVTQEWQEKRWFKYLREMDVRDTPPTPPPMSRSRRNSRVRVTSDIIFPGQRSTQIITADIGVAPVRLSPAISLTRPPLVLQESSSRHIQSTHTPHPFSAASRSNGFTPHIPITTAPTDGPTPLSHTELKTTLRRLSKMVLAGYGGASMLFFGAAVRGFEGVGVGVGGIRGDRNINSRITESGGSQGEEARLAHAIDASEAEVDGQASLSSESYKSASSTFPSTDMGVPLGYDAFTERYSWWDVLLGKHDQEIFEHCAGGENWGEDEDVETKLPKADRTTGRVTPDTKKPFPKRQSTQKMRATAVVGNEHLMPRFWVLTDYGRSQVVVVLRGTMSLNEIAVDLTCDPVPFEPANGAEDVEEDDAAWEVSMDFQESPNSTSSRGDSGLSPMLSSDVKDTSQTPSPTAGSTKRQKPRYQVHGGMLRMARAMGGVGKPVQAAVREALRLNPGFELVLCGHSLGAGVAAMLGMMWADPTTCLTVRSSGLPTRRRTYVYCFGPPTLTSGALSRLASKLIISLVYSHDVVARISLGTTRDLKNAALWLCEAQDVAEKGNQELSGMGGSWRDGRRKDEGWEGVTRRARAWGRGEGGEMDWFIAIRKTLEANMVNVHMYPPGRILWAMRESDLHPHHRRSQPPIAPRDKVSDMNKPPDKLRLFEVLDVEQVFSQLVFARNMLSAHLPHEYDRVLHDLL